MDSIKAEYDLPSKRLVSNFENVRARDRMRLYNVCKVINPAQASRRTDEVWLDRANALEAVSHAARTVGLISSAIRATTARQDIE